MLNNLKKELIDKIKICTGNLFSDDVYEKIILNEDLTINTLFADKEFQSKSIFETINIIQYMQTQVLKDGIFLLGSSYTWLEDKIETLISFQIKLVSIIDDYQGQKMIFNSKIKHIYQKNKDKIHMPEEDFVNSMENITLNMAMRVLNVIYIDEQFVATQSFDKSNIESFYH